MADDLREILDLAKRSMPDVPEEVWKRFEQLTRINFGAQRMYIASHKKGRHLAIIEQAIDQDLESLSKKLGVTVRQVRNLKKIGR